MIWPDTVPDCSNNSSTPGLVSDKNIKELNYALMKREEFQKLKTINNYNDNQSFTYLNCKIYYTYKKVPAAFIEMAFPEFPYPVFYEEIQSSVFETSHSIAGRPPNAKLTQNAGMNFSEVIVVSDYDDELNRNDPIEDQCLLILRDDENPQQLIPNREEVEKLEKCLKKPNIEEMKEEERTLVWRFRYTLRQKKDALTKFLHSVKWSIPKEEEEALVMLEQWAKIDSDDALHLLSVAFSANDYYIKKQRLLFQLFIL